MTRSIVTAMVLGLLVGAACKKNSDSSAKETPKTQETAAAGAAKQDTPMAAPGEDPGVAAGGIEHAADEGAAGMLASVNGTVEVRRVGETQWTAAKADTKLYAGDIVRTQDQSTATISLADESVIEVAEASSVSIASRDGSADPASSAAVLAGLARFTVTPRTPGEGAFRVYTPTAVVVTKGTTYGVGVAASGEARVGVESGTVDVLGVTALDAQPVAVASSTQVVVAADGKVGTASAWATDDWGTWRDESDAKAELAVAIKMHTDAMAELNAALASSYAELQANADSAATFEANASAAADKNDTAAYTAAQPEGAATIDASFALAGRLEALTWAYTGHATLATELYLRHPTELQAQWDAAAPRVDASVLWPKRFEVTATAFWQPLRTQYYVHHPIGRMHAPMVGITVPRFYAQVTPAPLDPMVVRGKVKGQIWMAPEIAYTASPRPVWVAMPSADWPATVKVKAAPPRAKVAWYVRPPTLKATAFVGAPIKGTWQSKLQIAAPQPRAALAASWKIPVGMKIKVDAPDMKAAANARMHANFNASGGLNTAAMAGANAKGKIDAKAKLDVKAPAVAMPEVKAPEVKVDVKAHENAAAHAAGDMKAKVDGAVKANANVNVKAKADVKVQAPAVHVDPPKPPAVKVEGKAKAGFKLGM